MHEVTFLGHKCTDKGILPDDKKFDVILNYPVPHDSDSARRFIAFCYYYRRFIKNFADYSRHITRKRMFHLNGLMNAKMDLNILKLN